LGEHLLTVLAPKVTTTGNIGPQTLHVGFLGVCVQAPTNCSGPFSTFTLAPGFEDFYTLIVEQSLISRITVTTETHQLASSYEIDDAAPMASIPTLNEIGLLALAAAMGTLAMHRLRRRRLAGASACRSPKA
jgi:hypothetical protein